ncbi:MAG: Stk1 family PASTA domain-containing Ser/Thr kinase [Coriobacteriia bacterium]|nr:Stk1 family PASTA domain-containing Ser/Thr kinase [Coriobacteriia bacterium]
MEELFLGQRYRATEQIGTGGMADVYKAVDEVLGRTVAVKVMHAHLAEDPSFAARFRHEAQSAANLMSPNIVNMYDWGQDDGTFYIVMEYVRGTDLKSMIEREGALPSRTVAQIGEQVCAALSVAHGYGIIHRDIKPHNIMVQADGAVKLMDFGIARAGPSMMTQTGSVLGTAQYLSPEAALGTPLTTASDLYSLGVALYEAATGHVPFDGDTPVSVALKQVNEEAVSPNLVNPGIEPALSAVIVKAMQKQTADRYVSAGDLQRDLSAIAQGRSQEVAAAGYAGMVAGLGVPGAAPHVAPTAVMPQVSAPVLVGPIESSEALEAPQATAPEVAPQRRPVWHWIVLAVLLLLAGLGALCWGMDLLGGQDEPVPDVDATTGTDAPVDPVPVEEVVMVEIPDIIGMREDEAVETLERAGFTPEALPPQYNSDERKGKVFEQTPPDEEMAPKGSVVTYVVSLGDAPGKNDRDDEDD